MGVTSPCGPPIRKRQRTAALQNLAAHFILFACLFIAAAPLRADVLDEWNDAVLNAIRRENTPPPLAARNLAILHLAILDSVKAVNQPHATGLTFRRADGSAATEAAITGAADQVARTLFPSGHASFEALCRKTKASWKAGAERTNDFALGLAAASTRLDERASDGAHTTLAYIPSDQPGAWRRTPPFFRPPDLPGWGCMKPFVLHQCKQFRPPPPPALDSRAYADDFNEVKRLGGKVSTARSSHETETAQFWSDFTGTVTPSGHWNQITRAIAENEHLSLPEKARLLALVNLALADAAVVAWDAKYTYNFWRPITAIRRAAEDGNADTLADTDWQPLLVTPAFPEYVSGHSTFSGAAGEVLTRFFGRDDLAFTATSDTLPGVVRRYSSVSQVVEEIGRSRILGGIHFPSADRAGQAAGRAVGAYVLERMAAISARQGPVPP